MIDTYCTHLPANKNRVLSRALEDASIEEVIENDVPCLKDPPSTESPYRYAVSLDSLVSPVSSYRALLALDEPNAWPEYFCLERIPKGIDAEGTYYTPWLPAPKPPARLDDAWCQFTTPHREADIKALRAACSVLVSSVTRDQADSLDETQPTREARSERKIAASSVVGLLAGTGLPHVIVKLLTGDKLPCLARLVLYLTWNACFGKAVPPRP